MRNIARGGQGYDNVIDWRSQSPAGNGTGGTFGNNPNDRAWRASSSAAERHCRNRRHHFTAVIQIKADNLRASDFSGLEKTRTSEQLYFSPLLLTRCCLDLDRKRKTSGLIWNSPLLSSSIAVLGSHTATKELDPNMKPTRGPYFFRHFIMCSTVYRSSLRHVLSLVRCRHCDKTGAVINSIFACEFKVRQRETLTRNEDPFWQRNRHQLRQRISCILQTLTHFLTESQTDICLELLCLFGAQRQDGNKNDADLYTKCNIAFIRKELDWQETLEEANLRIQPIKCSFVQDSVEYLGHVVSSKGVKPNQKILQSIKELPRAKNVAEVRSVVEFSQPFIVSTDASNYAIGAVLSQMRNGHEKTIAYARRQLNLAERSYSTTEKELCALVFATKQFRAYLYGRRFTVITDHATLRWLLNLKDPISRPTRWVLRFAEFDFEVVHKQGKKHANTDCLSRMSHTTRVISHHHVTPFSAHQGVKRTQNLLKSLY
ncbi:hypothetical protein PR048_019705 [Dryococelus australis]|uniref:Reverse transcriptase RNase H-like domain-containing protein n=1 Tax=Dryococelus australis TaxID=614101 RepID=A0ABQ9H4A7_9NEOP|nr:hypothetical protein PR048_019705 [Dryococelus australis]